MSVLHQEGVVGGLVLPQDVHTGLLAYRCFKKTQIGLDQNIISDEWNSSEALGLDRKDGHPNSNAFFGRAPSLLLGLCKKI